MRPSEIGGGHHKTPTHPLKPSFKDLDVNKDGKLTGNETKKVDGYDSDKNKEISKDEFKAGRHAENAKAHEQKLKEAYAKFDVNKDGKLTGSEDNKLKGYDANHDGNVDADEFKKGRAAENKKALEAKFDEVFSKMEINDDKVLSGTEAKKHKDWDADHDGQITKDEALAGWKADRKEAYEKHMLTGAKVDDLYKVEHHEAAEHKHKADHPHKPDHKHDHKKTKTDTSSVHFGWGRTRAE